MNTPIFGTYPLPIFRNLIITRFRYVTSGVRLPLNDSLFPNQNRKTIFHSTQIKPSFIFKMRLFKYNCLLMVCVKRRGNFYFQFLKMKREAGKKKERKSVKKRNLIRVNNAFWNCFSGSQSRLELSRASPVFSPPVVIIIDRIPFSPNFGRISLSHFFFPNQSYFSFTWITYLIFVWFYFRLSNFEGIEVFWFGKEMANVWSGMIWDFRLWYKETKVHESSCLSQMISNEEIFCNRLKSSADRSAQNRKHFSI